MFFKSNPLKAPSHTTSVLFNCKTDGEFEFRAVGSEYVASLKTCTIGFNPLIARGSNRVILKIEDSFVTLKDVSSGENPPELFITKSSVHTAKIKTLVLKTLVIHSGTVDFTGTDLIVEHVLVEKGGTLAVKSIQCPNLTLEKGSVFTGTIRSPAVNQDEDQVETEK